jgi:hypothetical protein
MKLEYAFLADAATVLDNGLFDVVRGGFDVVQASSFPATKYVMLAIGRIWFEPAECGKKHILCGQIIDRNGTPVFTTAEAEFMPAPHPRHPERGKWMTVCLNCQGVVLPEEGDYSFCLLVGNQKIGEVSFEAILEESLT